MEVLLVFQFEKSSPDDWQKLICQLDGVYAAKVILSADKLPEEIHILATESKSPKALTRDIQSALMAVFDISVDYRIISIAQVSSKMIGKNIRLRFSGIHTKYIDGAGEISVILNYRDQQQEGKASYTGRHTFSRYRGVALATLDAVSKCINNNCRCQFELLSAKVIELAGKPAMLVALMDKEGYQLIGSASIEEDNDNAIVRAVLDAVNRRISQYIVN
jgi:hypothetical protein